MKPYCLKCRTDTENINPKVSNTSNSKTIKLSNGAICDGKKSRFFKHKETQGLLSKLGVKTPVSKAPLLGNFLL